MGLFASPLVRLDRTNSDCLQMSSFVAQRITFRNGERHSLLQRVGSLPVHEVTLYLGKYRNKGRAANTIHFVCSSLALLYRELDAADVDLLERLSKVQFLTGPELDRLVSAARYRSEDLEAGPIAGRSNVIDIRRIGIRRTQKQSERQPVDAQTYASRLRYMADFLSFISAYVAATLPRGDRQILEADAKRALTVFREHIPEVSHRAKLGARVGLSVEEQDQVLSVVHPDSPNNPWVRNFVRRRNWLIVVLLLASGMRRGELLGLQIGDLHPSQPKLNILRRADDPKDRRSRQPNTKTYDRTVELSPPVMRALQAYLKERRGIKAARSIPQIIVSEDGRALSMQAVDKIFKELRTAMPHLSLTLTSHVMRHTWNERFSEQAEAMNLTEVAEQRARNSQQGWSDHSKAAAVYTRRYTEKKGRELALKLQERLDDKLRSDK